ncbi:unnamed protein product [Echinostoma caproni]|uniref:Sema domain-containing protein n=1 Tax=Echinostoma caproni TaxID=27848 RepID=A0A183AJM4_9TREM|nr:unnamed protein product [Echinostoma caproni]
MHESLLTLFVCVLFQWLISVWRPCESTTHINTALCQLRVTHNASIVGTNDTRNLRVLYRLYGPNAREFVFVAGTNHVYQFDAHHLRRLSTRVTGPQNFSILCSDEHECSYCRITPNSPWPKGYSAEFCGPRPTDNFVRAWATSTVAADDDDNHMFQHGDSLTSPVYDVVINDDRIACEDALYLCYNAHHGYCERVRLQNVSTEAPWHGPFGQPHPTTQSNRVAVVGCDPIMHATIVVGAQYVYAATEPDILKSLTLFSPDPLSARARDFQLVNSNRDTKTVVTLTDDSSIPLQYKFSFRYRIHPLSTPVSDPTTTPVPAHVYFVLQQPRSARFTHWQPRVARICEGDKHFYSYVELNLVCYQCAPIAEQKHKTLNALHTSSRGQVGRILANQLKQSIEHILQRLTDILHASLEAPRVAANTPGWEDFHEVLLVAFAAQPVDPSVYWYEFAQEHGGQPMHYIRSSFLPDVDQDQIGAILLSGSALSLFSMAHIDAQFTNVIRNCLDGRGTRGPPHFLRLNSPQYMGCVPEAYLADQPYYCPAKAPMNHFITGEKDEDRLEAPSFLYLSKNVTGLAITVVSVNFTVCLITTDDGWLFKYEVVSLNESRLLESRLLAPAGTPLTGISLDFTGTVAFVTSLSKMIVIIC